MWFYLTFFMVWGFGNLLWHVMKYSEIMVQIKPSFGFQAQTNTRPPSKLITTPLLPARFLPIASGSVFRPLLNDPTVCPLGLGGRRGSRVAGGLPLLSWNNLRAPPTREPPFFSRIQIYKKREHMHI
jgi:hypothetical protein